MIEALTRRRLSLLALLVSSALLAACGGSSSPAEPQAGNSTLEIQMTDNHLDGVDAVVVTISSVEVHHTGGPVREALDEPLTLDLLQIRDRILPLATVQLEAGKITQIVFIVTGAHIEVNGEVRPLEIPSGTVKLVGNFDLPDGALAVLLVDFDAEASVKVTHTGGGNDRYILRPVINKVSYDVKTEEDCPDLASTVPADGSVGVSVSTVVSATFPAGTPIPLDLSGLIELRTMAGVAVAGTTSTLGTTVTLTPDADLAAGTTYTATVRRGQLPGLGFCPEVTFTFTTSG